VNDSTLQISRTLLAIIFFVSSFGKLRDLSMFTAVVQVHLGLRSRKVSRALATLTVASELLVAIMLILPGTMLRGGIIGASNLLLAFTVVMTRNVLRKSPLDCFCFGHADHDMGRWLPLVRLGLLGFPLIPLFARWTNPPSTWPTGLEVAAALLLCAVGTWILAFPGIVTRHRQDTMVALGTGVIDLSRAPLAPITVLRQTEE